MKIKKLFFILLPLIAFILLACTNDSTQDLEQTNEINSKQGGTKLFQETGFGFTISYPDHWTYETDNFLVVFSGPENTDEYYTTVNIQNLIKGEGGYTEMEDIYRDYEMQLNTAGSATMSDMKYGKFEQDNLEYPMMQFDVQYEQNNENFKQIIFIIERPDNVYHQFSYTAPKDLYELSEHTSKTMYDSLKLEL
jgi:hypothetical protein